MKIEYLGHSCFYLADSSGLTVIIDPYDATVGYRMPMRQARYTLVTHPHWDHAHTQGVLGATHVIQGSGVHGDESLKVRGVLAFHDAEGGARLGVVNLLCFEMDGLRVCHLSDLGHVLEPSQVEEIGPVDVAMIPVGGGRYTVDGATARKVVGQLSPRVIIPMHYMTALTNRRDFPIEGVDPFLQGVRHVERVRSGEMDLRPETLPTHSTVYVMTPTC